MQSQANGANSLEHGEELNTLYKEGTDASCQVPYTSPILDRLVQRCQVLLKELDEFTQYLQQRRKRGQVQAEISQFMASVRKERNILQKLSSADLTQERVQSMISCSNLPFLEAVWAAAKRTSNVVGLKKRNGFIDVTAEGGLLWIKVSTVTETRLLFDIAKQGWINDSGSDDDDENGPGNASNEDDDDSELSLLKAAEKLTKAAKAVRVNYRHPQVHFVLPRTTQGRTAQVDEILDSIRAAGATVQCANDLSEAPPLSEVLNKIVANGFENFSRTLNIDCTILLALVSDISHGEVARQPWFNKATERQIETEAQEPLLPSTLYPAMSDHSLVCTCEAVKRMREIVDIMGTTTEKARTVLLLGDDQEKSRDQLLVEFRQLSKHSVPDDWQLPIRIVDGKIDETQLPAVATKVKPHLSPLNRSVFFYGWASGNVTLSSNATVSKEIEALIEENRMAEDEVGPDIWLCPISRSLLAKEKDRRDGEGTAET